MKAVFGWNFGVTVLLKITPAAGLERARLNQKIALVARGAGVLAARQNGQLAVLWCIGAFKSSAPAGDSVISRDLILLVTASDNPQCAVVQRTLQLQRLGRRRRQPGLDLFRGRQARRHGLQMDAADLDTSIRRQKAEQVDRDLAFLDLADRGSVMNLEVALHDHGCWRLYGQDNGDRGFLSDRPTDHHSG